MKAFLDSTSGAARERGYAETLAGRRRYLPDLRSRQPRAARGRGAHGDQLGDPGHGGRPDQAGDGADRCRARGSAGAPAASMILQVHDELVFEVGPRAASLRDLVAATCRESPNSPSRCGSWGRAGAGERPIERPRADLGEFRSTGPKPLDTEPSRGSEAPREKSRRARISAAGVRGTRRRGIRAVDGASCTHLPFWATCRTLPAPARGSVPTRSWSARPRRAAIDAFGSWSGAIRSAPTGPPSAWSATPRSRRTCCRRPSSRPTAPAQLRDSLVLLHLALPDHGQPRARPPPPRAARADARVGRQGRAATSIRAAVVSVPADPEVASRRVQVRELVAKGVQELPDGQREVLLLREVEGLCYEEIAQTMEISKGTVMSRLHYARKKMIVFLKEHGVAAGGRGMKSPATREAGRCLPRRSSDGAAVRGAPTAARLRSRGRARAGPPRGAGPSDPRGLARRTCGSFARDADRRAASGHGPGRCGAFASRAPLAGVAGWLPSPLLALAATAALLALAIVRPGALQAPGERSAPQIIARAEISTDPVPAEPPAAPTSGGPDPGLRPRAGRLAAGGLRGWRHDLHLADRASEAQRRSLGAAGCARRGGVMHGFGLRGARARSSRRGSGPRPGTGGREPEPGRMHRFGRHRQDRRRARSTSASAVCPAASERSGSARSSSGRSTT